MGNVKLLQHPDTGELRILLPSANLQDFRYSLQCLHQMCYSREPSQLVTVKTKGIPVLKKKKPPKNKNYRKVGSLVQMESKKSGLKSFRKKPSGLDVINFSLKVGFVFLPPLFN